MFDPFLTLGLSPETATLDQARQQYRSLARAYHPDQSGGDAALMAEVTRAWREIRTPEKFDEISRVVIARRSEAVRIPTTMPHMHDVHSSDGLIHMGPYTRGTCAEHGEVRLREMRQSHRKSCISAALRGRFGALRKEFVAPSILIPGALSLSADRLYFYASSAVAGGSTLLCIPQIRQDSDGIIGYSGALTQSLLIDIPHASTGLIGLGLNLVQGSTPTDAILVFEGV